MPLVPAFVVTGLMAVATFLFSRSTWTWSGWLPATCVSTNCFCESVRAGPVAQPINTYSNLAFVFIGLLIMRSDLQRCKRLNRFFGLIVIFIGLGSLFYHASLSFAGQWLDVMGMYLLVTWALLSPIRFGQFRVIYVLLNLGLAVQLITLPDLRRQVFATLTVVTLGSQIAALRTRYIGDGRYLFAGAAVFGAGYIAWVLDNSLRLCSPDSVLQGHALWHLTSAIAAGLLFLHLASTNPPRDSLAPR